MNHIRSMLALLALAFIAQGNSAPVEWRYYSGDNGSRKYSPLD